MAPSYWPGMDAQQLNRWRHHHCEPWTPGPLLQYIQKQHGVKKCQCNLRTCTRAWLQRELHCHLWRGREVRQFWIWGFWPTIMCSWLEGNAMTLPLRLVSSGPLVEYMRNQPNLSVSTQNVFKLIFDINFDIKGERINEFGGLSLDPRNILVQDSV